MTALRVMLADDEAAARRFLKRLLKSSEPKVDLVGEVSNGQELLSLLADGAPDVLFLDIMMPGLTGLDVLRKIDAQSGNMKVLIVSAHDRFEFAREALVLGVFDYLLKPVKLAELNDALARCAKQLAGEREREESSQSLLKKARITDQIARSTILHDLLTGVPTGLGKVSSWNHLELLDVESLRSMIAADVPPDETSRAGEAVAGWADAHGSVWCMPGKGRIVVIPASKELDTPAKLGALAKEFCLLLKSALPESDPAEVRVAFAGPSSSPDLSRQYVAIRRALNRAYITGETLISVTFEVSDEQGSSGSVFSLESRLAAEVKSGSPRTALLLLRDLVEQAASLPDTGHEFLGLEMVAVISQACAVASESACDHDDLIELRNTSVMRLIKAGSTDEMVRVAKDCLEQVFQRLEVGETASGRLVSAAKAVIDERASEDLTLSDVASTIFVSPFYLSRLFKQECGLNFHDYLTDVRISRAKALLRDTDTPCRVVAQAVGYASASYFSQIFKRCTGKSPAEFRDSIRGL